MKKLNEIVDKLDSLTEQVNRLEQGINKLIDAVETSAFKEQMRDIQASVLKIESKSFRLSSFFWRQSVNWI